jgi:hypothetical protein
MASIRVGIHLLNHQELTSYRPSAQFLRLRQLRLESPARNSGAGSEGIVDLVVVRVCIKNISDGPIAVRKNLAFKAELLGLQVWDIAGERIPAVRQIHVSLKAGVALTQTLSPNEEYQFDLVGEVQDGWLYFPGAKYELPSNRAIEMRFRYGRVFSNLVHLRK